MRFRVGRSNSPSRRRCLPSVIFKDTAFYLFRVVSTESQMAKTGDAVSLERPKSVHNVATLTNLDYKATVSHVLTAVYS